MSDIEHEGSWKISHIWYIGACKVYKSVGPLEIKAGFVHFTDKQTGLPHWISGNIDITPDNEEK